MRVEVFGNDFKVSAALRRYAEARVLLALHSACARLSWLGVRFIGQATNGVRPRVACQIDAWLRPGGLVTVRHTDTNAYVGVDCAAVRLRQAITSRLRRARPTRHTSTNNGQAERPRLGVVVVPAGRSPRLGLGPWLHARYGIEQLQTISMTGVEWDGLTSSGESSRAAERLRERLALSLLGLPELVVVAGYPPLDNVRHACPQSRRDVERIVEHIRSWNLPVEVVGAWVNERWGVDECLVESEEVESHEPAEISVLGVGVSPQWLAESVWETEGGRLKESRPPAVAADRLRTQRRNRHVDSDHGRRAAGRSKAEQGRPSRHAVGGLPGFRPNPARLAHS